MILNFSKLYKKYNMNITGVIHIGAHFGEELSLYNKYGIKNIIFFEPVKKTFEVLKKRVNDSVLIYNVALGDINGQIEMNVEVEDKWGCSSILQPSSNYDSSVFDDKKEKVNIRTLDSYKFDNKYNLLNIDVQGYEMNVFMGARKYLNNVDYIYTEVHRINKKPLDYIGAPLIEDISFFLKKYNFELKEVSWAGKSWGDALYIKNKKI